ASAGREADSSPSDPGDEPSDLFLFPGGVRHTLGPVDGSGDVVRATERGMERIFPGHSGVGRGWTGHHIYRLRFQPHVPTQDEWRNGPRVGGPPSGDGRRCPGRPDLWKVPDVRAWRARRCRKRAVDPTVLRGSVRRYTGPMVRRSRGSTEYRVSEY